MAEDKKFGRIVLFTGAGASVRLGMPTMRTFMQGLSEWDEPLRTFAGRLLGAVPEMDAEYLYDRLQLYAEAGDAAATDPIMQELFAGTTRDAEEFRRDAHHALSQLQSLILRTWGSVRARAHQDLHYAIFLHSLHLGNGAPLRAFTTNYDLTFESLPWFDLYDHSLVNGLAPGMWTHDMEWEPWNYDLDEIGLEEHDRRMRAAKLLVYRLHGCSHWFSDEDGTIVYQARPTVAEPTLAPMVIFPALRDGKQMYYEVFHHSYRAMQQSLTDADLCLVIGYSFRDEAVCRAFLDAPYETHFLIVDPDADIDRINAALDWHKWTHMPLAFGDNGADEAILRRCWELLGNEGEPPEWSPPGPGESDDDVSESRSGG